MGKQIECVYWGIFFPGHEFETSLEKPVEDKHVTFGFKTPMPADLLGKSATVSVTGYGNDGRNEALLVDFESWCWDIFGLSVPHITLSTSTDGKPVDSANLEFDVWEWDKCYDVEGVFGYFDGEKIVAEAPTFSVAYLCDGKKPECCEDADCYALKAGELREKDLLGKCFYTLDVRHAANFVPVGDDPVRFAERMKPRAETVTERPTDSVVYEYYLEAGSVEEAGDIANGFHRTLCGNPDYRDSRIILNWSGSSVTLSEFRDSSTHVEVRRTSDGSRELMFL